MALLFGALICMSGLTLSAAMRAGQEHAVDPVHGMAAMILADVGSDWSDAFEDSELDEEDLKYTYYTRCMRRAAVQRESHEAGPSCSFAAQGSIAPLYGVDEDAFDSKCFEWKGTREQEKSLAEHFNLQLHQVKRLKRQLSRHKRRPARAAHCERALVSRVRLIAPVFHH